MLIESIQFLPFDFNLMPQPHIEPSKYLTENRKFHNWMSSLLESLWTQRIQNCPKIKGINTWQTCLLNDFNGTNCLQRLEFRAVSYAACDTATSVLLLISIRQQSTPTTKPLSCTRPAQVAAYSLPHTLLVLLWIFMFRLEIQRHFLSVCWKSIMINTNVTGLCVSAVVLFS